MSISSNVLPHWDQSSIKSQYLLMFSVTMYFVYKAVTYWLYCYYVWLDRVTWLLLLQHLQEAHILLSQIDQPVMFVTFSLSENTNQDEKINLMIRSTCVPYLCCALCSWYSLQVCKHRFPCTNTHLSSFQSCFLSLYCFPPMLGLVPACTDSLLACGLYGVESMTFSPAPQQFSSSFDRIPSHFCERWPEWV